jgi:hypothetical protein
MSSPTAIRRGDIVSVTWPRNNHPGGIIRLAWAPVSTSSPTADAFDAGVVKYTCHEFPCNEQNQCDADLRSGCTPCATTVQVPAWLQDGVATLQWVWYGGGYGLSPYYSCMDYRVDGGLPVDATAKGTVFVPGDAVSTSSCWLCAGCDTSFRNGPTLSSLLAIGGGSGSQSGTPGTTTVDCAAAKK